MDQKILVKESLSAGMISEGKQLLQKLEDSGWIVQSAFWVFNEEDNLWRLFICSPRVDADGPRSSYEHVAVVFRKEPFDAITLQDVSLISTRHKLSRLFRNAIQTGPSLQEVRFSRNMIDGHYISDALVYRSN